MPGHFLISTMKLAATIEVQREHRMWYLLIMAARRPGMKPKPKRKRDKGKVTWVDKTGAKPAPFAQDLPRNRPLHEAPANVAGTLVIGTLFEAIIPLNPYEGTLIPYFNWHPAAASNTGALCPIGSIIIYAGPVRVDERQSNGRIISVIRHTFIASGGRYAISDLTNIKPVH